MLLPLQYDLLELRDAHAKLRTTNEKLRRDKDKTERERDEFRYLVSLTSFLLVIIFLKYLCLYAL